MKVTSQKVGGSMAGTEAAGTTGKTNKTDLDKTGLGTGSAVGVKPTSSEKVNLSQRVMDMQRIKELATPQDSIDEAKVARLQKLIDDGQYKLDADAIADRMVDEHFNMPS